MQQIKINKTCPVFRKNYWQSALPLYITT